jgi:circadian clock protein KaiC
MNSIGINLDPYISSGQLEFHAARPTFYGLEMHLVTIYETVKKLQPQVVVFDPITNLTCVGTIVEVKSMLTRLIDFLKSRQITALFNSLTAGGANPDQTEVGVSSLMDSWLLLRNLESGGERNRALYILKSRGMSHSNQVREFVISGRGIDLLEPYLGNGQVFTGSARLAQEAREESERVLNQQRLERHRREIERKRRSIEAQIGALQAELESGDAELKLGSQQEAALVKVEEVGRIRMSRARGGAVSNGSHAKKL